MNGLAAGALGVSGLFLVVIALVLAILGLLMPLYVYRISQETKKTREALDRVEGLIRTIKERVAMDGVLVIPKKK